jgi:predicted nucleic acid-binding protein
MAALNYLLDTTVLIDASNGISPAEDFLVKHHLACAISPVTRAELLAGAEEERVAAFSEWLSAFQYLPLDEPCADLAAKFRREHKWKLPDAFQAAMAIRHNLRLVTRNTRDFPPTKHSFVVVPYRI